MRKMFLLVFLIAGLAWGDTLVLKDGTTHNGVVESTTDQYVVFREGGMNHRYSRSEVQSIQFSSSGMAEQRSSNDQSHRGPNDHYRQENNYSSNESSRAPINGSGSITLAQGTDITVRTDETIDSQNANEGQRFPAEVSEDVVDSAGRVVIPRGSQAELNIRDISSGHGVTGSPELALGLDSVTVAGRRYRVSSEAVTQKGDTGLGKNKRTGEMVGGGAVLGTLIGAIAGGGKGAAIGAIAGAGAGAGTQVLTRGKNVKVPSETLLHFQLDRSLQMQPE